MALTAQEEALVRQLLEEQAAILSLANSEATILSKLGATKVTLSDLTAVSTVADANLMLMRQGTTDRAVSGTVLAAYTTGAIPAASTSVQGKVELATDAEAQAGTDTVRAVTPDNLGAVVLGLGQTWQDVTGSRVSGTSYTNSTGRSIMVAVTVGAPTGVGNFTVVVAGVTVVDIAYTASNTTRPFASFVVPPGAVYTTTAGSGIIRWSELR